MIRVLHVASEAAPYSQSGGLGQVVGALPGALAADPRCEVAVLTPLYNVVGDSGIELEDTGLRYVVSLAGADHAVALRRARESPRFVFVDCPPLYDRPGLYTDSSNHPWPDNATRFAVLSRVALDCGADLLGPGPDIIHAHDWQTGLIAAYIAALEPAASERPRTVFTIHNLAYQGVFDKSNLLALGLDWSMFTLDGLEFYDQVNFLKAGAAYADAITTVSPTYASEILLPEFGQGLDGFFRDRVDKLSGILNGIDTETWNPETDPLLAANYSAADLDGKLRCRQALCERFDIDVGPDQLLCGVVSRLTAQKGPDIIADLAPRLSAIGAALLVLGSGEPEIESRFATLAAWFGDNLSVIIGFDDEIAHLIFAGSDALLMPSHFEPCGLGQLIAMRYGTLPIVSAVGGLRDTVSDTVSPTSATGFCLTEPTVDSLESATVRAATIMRDRPTIWRRMMVNAMSRDWSWTRAAGEYLALYELLLE